RECWAGDAFKERPIWLRASQDTNAKQDAEEESRNIARATLAQSHPLLLSSADAPLEEKADFLEIADDRRAQVRIVRSHLECRIDQHATASVWILQRALDDFSEKSLDRVFRCLLLFEPGDALAHGVVQVVLERLGVERALVAERVVEARASN